MASYTYLQNSNLNNNMSKSLYTPNLFEDLITLDPLSNEYSNCLPLFYIFFNFLFKFKFYSLKIQLNLKSPKQSFTI